MSLEYVSKKRNRVYKRKFDYDIAQARYASGESVPSIARDLGVSPAAVYLVVNPETKARQEITTRRWTMSGVCSDCGKEGICRYPRRTNVLRCRRCAALRTAISVREGFLLCANCRLWKEDTEFCKNSKNYARRGRHRHCRTCSTKLRAAYRNRHKVACQGDCGRMVEGKGRANRFGQDPNRPYLCRHCWQRYYGSMNQTNEWSAIREQRQDPGSPVSIANPKRPFPPREKSLLDMLYRSMTESG